MIGETFARWGVCLGAEGATACRIEGMDAALLAAAAVLLALAGRRLLTAVLSLPGLSATPALSRRLSRWVKTTSYEGDDFFRADGAGEGWVGRRREAFARLAERLAERGKKASAFGDAIREGFSDLRFADANRVPPPFAKVTRETFDLCSVATASEGPRLLDLDGHWNLDVGGSYGVNVAGYDFYKGCIERAWLRVKDLGPVLGPLHPVVAENIDLLKSISGADEVSFHTSGTEAVMAAVRLARFNTRREKIAVFSGAYHGWWDGVQPGIGSERSIGDCLPLVDLSEAALGVIRRRRREIAGVLVNPVQAFHPNQPPPGDAVLLTSEIRKTRDSTECYLEWLRKLRAVCDESGVPLIFDEVYSGFRLAPGGAQELFGVKADMVLYGKTVAGGLPIGVVCGRRDLMRRVDPERPMRIAYVIGTFSAHPFVMAAMNEFLRWVVQAEAADRYAEANARCATWAASTHRALSEEGLPVRVMHLGTVWTVLFTEPGRYNWLLQYYLRAEGLALSWVGTGRCLVSLDFTREHYDELQRKLLSAAREMKRDGWWLTRAEQPRRDWTMRTLLFREVVGSLVRLPRPLRSFYADIMQRKHDDHEASHHDPKNQTLHLLSSSVFIFCYGLVFFNLPWAMGLGLAALFFRQIGHAVFEPVCHDKEKLLLGYTTPNKTMIVAGYLLLPLIHVLRTHGTHAGIWEALRTGAASIATQWFYWTLAVVAARVVYLIWKHGLRNSMIWFVKLVTDPFTDIVTYSPLRLVRR